MASPSSPPRPVRQRLAAVPALALVSSGLIAVAAPPAHAQTVGVSTPYPGVTVEAGGTTTLDLSITSSTPQTVDLSVQGAPDGWGTTFRGGGFLISSVAAGGSEGAASARLEVQVPAEASGATTFEVVADGADGGRSTLPVTLRVQESVRGAIALEAEFPELTGSATDTFTYSLVLRNATPNQADFALRASGPEGWEVTARPTSEARATTVTVPGGDEATVEVEATPPDGVSAGRAEIQVTATGAGQEANATLVAEVAGTSEFSLSTPDERLNASGSTGEVTRIPLVLQNSGSQPLSGVELSASPPSQWEVSFEPPTVQVAPGETGRVTALVTPSEDAVSGDYMVTFTASQEGTSEELDVRFTVQTSPVWGAVGVLVILAIVGGLMLVFRRYGRR